MATKKVILSKTQRYSYADYMTWHDDVRREIIDGVVTEMERSQTLPHARVTPKIMHRLHETIERCNCKCEVFIAPFDVRFPVNGETRDEEIFTVVQPDVCVICDPSKLDERGCLGVPDLIVEVLSSNSMQRDFLQKFNLYERSGVREYWVVSPEGRWIQVFTPQPDGRYVEDGTLYELGSPYPAYAKPEITSVVFPGETFPVASFFE